MSSGEHIPGPGDGSTNFDALSDRRRLVNGALYDARLPAFRLRNMAVAVAGRLMTNQAMFSAEQSGARRFLEVIFRSLERIDESSQAAPALSIFGKPFETAPGVVDADILLLDANDQSKKFEASNEILSPEAMGRHWVKNELADLHDYLIGPRTEGVFVPPVTPGETPVIERRPT